MMDDFCRDVWTIKVYAGTRQVGGFESDHTFWREQELDSIPGATRDVLRLERIHVPMDLEPTHDACMRPTLAWRRSWVPSTIKLRLIVNLAGLPLLFAPPPSTFRCHSPHSLTSLKGAYSNR